MLHVLCEGVEYVHRADPAFRADGAKPGPDGGWFRAAGQSPECSRFLVRPLNVHEYDVVTALDGKERAEAALQHGLVSIDGQPVNGDLAMAWVYEVANLVVALSTDPLRDGRRSRSEAGGATEPNAGGESPASP